MDTTTINTGSVWAVNSHEIFNYQPKRKIDIIDNNNNFSLYDKNFTYVISFHPISPYTFDSTIGENFLQANDIKCPVDFVNHDAYYLNLDAFDQYKDSTNAFYPILSLDGTCNYDSSSMEECEFYNCFTVFIYKGELHQVVNDATSQPAKVHCKIDISNIKEYQLLQHHLILTRNDNVWMMHLVLDRCSLFSFHEPIVKNAINYDRNFIDTAKGDVNFLDVTNNDATIDYDIEYTVRTTNTTIYKLWFDQTEVSNIILEFIADEITKMLSCSVSEHTGNTIATNGLYINTPTFSAPTIRIKNSAGTTVTATGSTTRYITYVDLPIGLYYVEITAGGTTYYDYSKVAFEAYSTLAALPVEKKWAITPHFTLKLHKNNSIDTSYVDYTYNIKTSQRNLVENINVSECVNNDASICIGYLERWPKNILIDTKLFKNSFKGYISEFSFVRDFAYLRKFYNQLPQNSFDYITDQSDANVWDRVPAYHLLTDEDCTIVNPWSSKSSLGYVNKVVVNENNIPCKTPWNVNSVNYGTSRFIPYTSQLYTYFPRSKYFTNYNLDDIILIDKDIIIDDTLIANKSELFDTTSITNKIVHFEFPFAIDQSSTNLICGNDFTTSNNPTFCIFTFDILQDLHNTSQVTIYDQVQFLMKSDYTQEIYDENITYQQYVEMDATAGYIRPETFSRFNYDKQSVLDRINNYMKTIYNDTTKLFVTKFVINCFRDTRYMFMYNVSEQLYGSDNKNAFGDNAYTYNTQNDDPINKVFDNLISPQHTNYNSIVYNNITTNKVFNQIGLSDPVDNPQNNCDYIYEGFFYTKQTNPVNYLNRKIYLGTSLDMYEADLIPFSYKKLLQTFTPVKRGDWDELVITDLDYDTIQIIDEQNNVYVELDFQYFKNLGNTLSQLFEHYLLTDGTVLLPFIYDMKMSYYINLHQNDNTDTQIVKEFQLTEGAITNFKGKFAISPLDSSTYVIEYDNSTIKDNDQLIVQLDFIDYDSTQSLQEYRLSQGMSFLYSHYLWGDPNIYPITKADGPSPFEVEQKKIYSDIYLIKSANLIRMANTLRAYATNRLTTNIQMLTMGDSLANTSLTRSTNIQLYYGYAGTDYNAFRYLVQQKNITYDGDKRIITSII